MNLPKLNKLKNEIPSFLKAFKDKTRRLNLTLLLLFFLIFPNQNYYQALQPNTNKPPIKSVNIDLSDPAPIPVPKNPKNPELYLTALSAVIVDLPSKTVIFAKQPDLPLLPASTNKIMTAVVALEHFKPADVLIVQESWNIGQVVGFKAGKKLTFENLLYALLVGSGNDAAQIIAQNYPGGYDQFIQKMNQKAKELNLEKTSFTNPSGIDAWNQKTTVRDLALLSVEALKNPLFKKTVATPKIEIKDLDDEKYLLENTNKLLFQDSRVLGVKTGWTEIAGECLVSYVKKEDKELIAVVLASSDRFGESEKIINWALENFSWEFIDTRYQKLPGQNP